MTHHHSQVWSHRYGHLLTRSYIQPSTIAIVPSEHVPMCWQANATCVGLCVTAIRALIATTLFVLLVSATGATVSWVNNLDLLVTGPDGVRYFPNGRTSPDPVNNVEKVRPYIFLHESGVFVASYHCASMLVKQARALLLFCTLWFLLLRA